MSATLTTDRARSVTPESVKPRVFRRDIQGLRAVAVIVVFLDHMIGWPAGGFIGVDMFFVISGFLITGLLLREYDRTGHISPKKFYIGRAKRIFPAATVVLIVTVLLAFLVFTPQRAISTAWDSFWSFFFAANWNLAVEGTDYFQQGGAVSPVQHYWSLSVEEQFYFVWPWLLLALLYVFARFGQRTTRRTHIIAGVAIGVISVASFGWALVQAASDPTVAYFSTFTRAWELGFGALLAVAAPVFAAMHPGLRIVTAYWGFAVMIASCFIITPEMVWPAPWALLPVIGTGLVIISGIGEEARFLWPLTNPVSVYIGNISYSLYLWHFPAIVFGLALFPEAGLLTYFGIAIAGFGLAIACYHAIERPIWKSPIGRAGRARSNWREWRTKFAPEMKLGALAGLSITTTTLVLLALLPTFAPPAPVQAYEPPAPIGTEQEASEPADASEALIGEIRASLSASTWPQLTPSIDVIGPEAKVAAWVTDGCLSRERGAETDFRETTERCVYGNPNGARTAVLVGDSMAISWLPAVEEALRPGGWRIQVFTMQQCPFVDMTVTKANGDAHPDCDQFHNWTASEIERIAPDLVIASQLDAALLRGVGGGSADAAGDAALTTLQRFAGADRTVAVLGAPVPTVALEECYTVTGSPRDCVRSVEEVHNQANSILDAAAGAVGDARATFVRTDSMFCLNSFCPAQVGGLVVRADGSHLTEVYSRHIGPALAVLMPEV